MKKCEICGIEITRPYGYSKKQWEKRKFCGRKCQITIAATYRLGKKMPQSAIEKIREFQKKKVFSLETRKKISDAVKGEKNKWWRGGLTEKNYKRRVSDMNSFEYRNWRKSVFQRDNYTCVECGIRGGQLNADHIMSYSMYPELRYSMENGRTLCVACHKLIGWRGNQHTARIITN